MIFNINSNFYKKNHLGPRPESYREDVESAMELETETEREDFYFHIKAGAESGWDYSTRWMINKNVIK